jgi:hypothetical protein
MKTRLFLIAVMSAAAFASFGQVENDDMYFTAKDRIKLNSTKPMATVRNIDDYDNAVATINPTDSYSGRGTNPEHTSQAIVNPKSQQSDPQYFVAGYQPARVNQNLNDYSSMYSNNVWNNPNTGGMNGFGSPYNSFNSPGFCNPNSFYQPGLNTSLGYTMGGFGSGWYGGMNTGWGNPSSMFWNNYQGMNSWNSGWGMNSGWGSGMNNYGYGGFYRPTTAIVVNNGDGNSGYAYGKRGSRSSDVNNYYDNTRNDGTVGTRGRVRTESANGRISSGESQYYNREWRNNPETSPNRSQFQNSSSGNRSIFNTNNSDWGNNRSSFESGSRSSFGSGSFGGSSGGSSRSSGGSGAGGRRGRD